MSGRYDKPQASRRAKFAPTPGLSTDDSLLVAVFLAIVIHVVIVLGINFKAPEPEKLSRSIDVTLVNTPAKKPPKEAKLLADDNQVGAGEHNEKPKPFKPKQELPSMGNNQGRQIVNKPLPRKVVPEESKPKVIPKAVTQVQAKQKIVAEPIKPAKVAIQAERPHLTAESLYQDVARLGTEIRESEQNSENTHITFISEVSTHKYVAAQYLKDWESKIERVGSRNYPEVANKKNFYGTLTMAVTINADGSLHDIVIQKSSGIQALDDAAKRIVKMSAPFPPLPLELVKELKPKILGITRVWKFADESMTTR
jgi:protein TonB